MLRQINFKHLHYFWVVAREGSIASASEILHLTPQTISGQLSLLEKSISSSLFERKGRGLVLTETGRMAYSYADEIFSLGQELGDVLRGTSAGTPVEFRVGIMDGIPKTIAYKLLEPALKLDHEITIVCNEGSIEQLLANLSIHKLDMILADMPLTSAWSIKAYNHELGDSGLSCFASPSLASQFKKGFPNSLNQAPMLLPTDNSTIRRSINQWLTDNDLYPLIVGEFDDSALMKSFGQAGVGLFFLPSIIEQEICKQYQVKVIGRVSEIREKLYAISAERKIRHPAVAAVCDEARHHFFEPEQY